MNETKELRKSIDKLEQTQSNLTSRKESFLRGMYYGLGFFIGGTVIVGLLVSIMSFFDTAPIIGEFISRILLFVK